VKDNSLLNNIVDAFNEEELNEQQKYEYNKKEIHNNKNHVYKRVDNNSSLNKKKDSISKQKYKDFNFVKDVKQFVREDKFDNTISVQNSGSDMNDIDKNNNYPQNKQMKSNVKTIITIIGVLLVITAKIIIPTLEKTGFNINDIKDNIVSIFDKKGNDSNNSESNDNEVSYNNPEASEIDSMFKKDFNNTASISVSYSDYSDTYFIYLIPKYIDKNKTKYSDDFSCFEANTSECRDDWNRMSDKLVKYSSDLNKEYNANIHIKIIDPDSYDTILSVENGKVINDYIDYLE
jgi:hypothetical protein